MTNTPEKIVYTARATVTGGREGHARSEDGVLDLALTAPKETGGPGTGTNPEQLFALGYGACFQGALSLVATKEGVDASGSTLDIAIGFGPEGQSFAITADITATIPGVDDATRAVAGRGRSPGVPLLQGDPRQRPGHRHRQGRLSKTVRSTGPRPLWSRLVSAMHIHEVDRHDDDALHAWWAIGREVSRHEPYDGWPAWEVSRAALPVPNPERDITMLQAAVDGVVVGATMLIVPTKENLHLAHGEVWVLPEHRRRGHGRALLADLEDRVRALGRRTLLVDAASAPGAVGPGLHLGLAAGFEEANTDQVKVLDLAAARPGWDGLRAEVAAHAGDYRVVAFGNEVPEDLIEGVCVLLSTFMAQIPLGALEIEDSEWTPERLRTEERRGRAIGRLRCSAAALAPDGAVVAFTDTGVNLHDPVRASIGITVVAPEHRGHRLGLAVKLASHDLLAETHPTCRDVVTGNADVNAAMNAINERMGYRVVEVCHELQKRL